MEDKWRNVPGYEGKYQINISTPEGRCRSLNYKGTGKTKELTNNPNKRDGRICWDLYKDGKRTNYQAARWIAMTFPELVQNEYFEGAEIDHIDTDRLNNHPSNLRWVTRKGNQNNPLTRVHLSESLKGRFILEDTRRIMSESNKGKKPSEDTRKKMSEAQLNRPDHSKWVIKLSLNNEILHFYPSISQAERETGINHANISTCCRGERKSAGGFTWKYAE